jgi:hypothetical protein
MPVATVAVLWIGLLAVGALTAEALRRKDGPATVNGTAALGLLICPVAAETVLLGGSLVPAVFGPAVFLWLAVAGVIHQLGMLGLYESVFWWDHLTHTVSAALVAAVAYALAIQVPGVPVAGVLAPSTLWISTIGATFVVGVCWEVLELAAHEAGHWLGIEPLLVPYGRRDTALDLVFDVVGAVLVLALDVRVFVDAAGLAAEHPAAARTALAWAGGVLLGGTAVLAVSVLAAQTHRR